MAETGEEQSRYRPQAGADDDEQRRLPEAPQAVIDDGDDLDEPPAQHLRDDDHGEG